MTMSIDWKKTAMEGFVIVASILLAFAIDAAWDSLQENRVENDVLTAVKAELEISLDYLKAATGFDDSSIEVSKRFLDMTPEQILDASSTQSGPPFISMFANSIYTPANNTLLSFNLSRVQDAEIRNAIGLWLGFAERLALDMPIMEREMSQLRDIASPYGAIAIVSQRSGLISESSPVNTPDSNQMFSELRANEQFVLELLSVTLLKNQIISKANNLMEQTELILDLMAQRGI